MNVRRPVVESMWIFLQPYYNRRPWEKLVMLMSTGLKQFGIDSNDEIPNRWELAMAIHPKEILIVGDRVFEPLVIGVNTLDGALHHIRSHGEPIQQGSSIVAIVIGSEKKNNERICHIDTDIWNEVKIKTHTIVKTKKNPLAKKKIRKVHQQEQKKGLQTTL